MKSNFSMHWSYLYVARCISTSKCKIPYIFIGRVLDKEGIQSQDITIPCLKTYKVFTGQPEVEGQNNDCDGELGQLVEVQEDTQNQSHNVGEACK